MSFLERFRGSQEPQRTPSGEWFSADNWIEAREYCKNLPENPTPEQLERVLAIAQKQEHWISRMEAVNVLARLRYNPQALLDIARKDDHSSIRGQATAWMTDYDGEMLKYRLKHEEQYKSNPLGSGWDELPQPVADAVVAAIDKDGNNDQVKMVGLSAKQMRNLGLERSTPPLDRQSLPRVIERSGKGLLDGQNFGRLAVVHEDRSVDAMVYNAFGPRMIPGCGVRVSTGIAESLGIERGASVQLRRQ